MERLRSLVVWLSPSGKADSQACVQPFSIKNAVLESVGSGNWMAERTGNDVGPLPTPLCLWLADVTLVALQDGSDPCPALCKQLSPSQEWWSQQLLIAKATQHLGDSIPVLGERGLGLVHVVERTGSALQVGSGLFWGIYIATICCHTTDFSVNELFQSLRLSVCFLPLHQFLNILLNTGKG